MDYSSLFSLIKTLLFSFIKSLIDFSDVYSSIQSIFSLGFVLAVIKGIYFLYSRSEKGKLLDDNVVIAEIVSFDINNFFLSRFQPSHNYDAASEYFDSLCTDLNNKQLKKEYDWLNTELKRISVLAKETSNDESAPESEFYYNWIAGWDFKPILPRYRNIDKELQIWNKRFNDLRLSQRSI